MNVVPFLKIGGGKNGNDKKGTSRAHHNMT
jgi:hypothetical protein